MELRGGDGMAESTGVARGSGGGRGVLGGGDAGSTASEDGRMEADEWEEGLAESYAHLLDLHRRPLFSKNVLYVVGLIW